MLLLVTNLIGKAVYSILWSHNGKDVAHLQNQTWTGKQLNTRTIKAGHIHAIHGTWVQTAKGLTINVIFGDGMFSGNHWHILLIPFHFYFWTNESNNRSRIFFGTDNIEFVVNIQQRFFIRYNHVTIVKHTRTNEIAPDKASHLQDAFVGNGRVEHLDGHQMRLHSLFIVSLVEMLFLFLEVYLKDDTNEDDATNDAHDSQRVGTCITISNYGYTSFEWMYLIDLFEGSIGSTKTWGVSHGTTQSTNHHGQIVNSRDDMAETVIDGYHHDDVQHDDTCCDAIGFQTSLFQ